MQIFLELHLVICKNLESHLTGMQGKVLNYKLTNLNLTWLVGGRYHEAGIGSVP